MNKKIFSLIIFSLLVKFCLVFFLHDAYFDTTRMMEQYNLAANFAEQDKFAMDNDFINQASKYNKRLNRNTDYNYLETLFKKKTEKIDTNPDITDTWGYAALLGAIWKITGNKSYIYIQLLQIFLDLLATLAIYSIVRKLFNNERLGIISAYIYACFIPFGFLVVIANRDYYAAWGLIFSLYFLIKEKTYFNWIMSALMVAIFSWMRPTIFLVHIIYTLYILVTKKSFKTGITFFAITTTIITAVFIFPFASQFNSKYGTYNFTEMSGGGLWEGLGEYPNKYHFILDDNAAHKRAVELGYPKDKAAFTPEFGRILKEDAMKIIRQDPMFYIKTLTKRYTRYIFSIPPVGLDFKYYPDYSVAGISLVNYAKTYPVAFFIKIIKKLLSVSLPVLALLSLYFYSKFWKEILLLLGIWQYKIGIHLPTHLEDRYVMEGYFPVVILATLTLIAIYNRLIKRTK